MADLTREGINTGVLDFVKHFEELDKRTAARVLAITRALVANSDDLGDQRVRQFTFTLHCGSEPDEVAVEVIKMLVRY